MTLEIHRPELETLIREWMKSGAFSSVEDALIQALKADPPSPTSHNEPSRRMGSELVEAMQSSPHKDIDLDSARRPMPVRTVAF
jgi:Arc/MetJ-type ribon-helix-helix transcriptional regulator